MPLANCWIVIDTSVIRETLKGNAELGIDLAELAALRRTAPVSLSQTAYIELANQLRQGAFTFGQWRAVAPALDAVIDREHPIVPLGIALRVMLGTATADGVDLDGGLRGLRAMWHVLSTARAPADLQEGRQIVFEGEPRRFHPSAIERELGQTGRRWAGIFDNVVKDLGRPIAPEDRSWLADGIRRGVGDEDVARVPERETAVQLAAEWHVLHGWRYEKGHGYKPKLNDAMDFDQLFALGLPAIICTSDGKFRERVRQLGTPGSDRVLSAAELIDRLRRDRAGVQANRLRSLRTQTTPSSTAAVSS